MRTRFAIVSAVVTLAALTAAATAVAFDVTNSTATTSQGWPITFNARSDLKGSLTYQVAGVTYSCKGYNRYLQTTVDHHTYPKSIANSTNCFHGEVRYFVHVEAIDRGEPGTSDAMCIKVSLFPARLNDNLVTDCGIIQKGNVQIHTENNVLTSELVATS